MKIQFILIYIMLSISCSEKTTVTRSGEGNNNTESFYRIEIEPSLSFDRSTLLMIHADSIKSEFNGIYSAQINNPIRKVELLGKDIHSPTLAVNSKMIAFLQNYNLSFYNQTLDSVYQISTDRYYQKTFFINDSEIIATYSSYILMFDRLSVNTFNIITEGFLPTLYQADTVAYLKSINMYTHIINLISTSQSDSISDSIAIEIDTIYAQTPTSFGIDPISRRYCYSIKNGNKYDIYAGGDTNVLDHFIRKSNFSGVVMLDANTIFYTGDDGRLYQTDFLGEVAYPFWAGVDSQD